MCRHYTSYGRQRINIALSADHRTRVQDRTASNLYIVTDHGTKFLDTGLNISLRCMYFHQMFIRFYIGRDGTRSHMCLVSKNRITHIVIMGNLYFIEKHHIFQFGGIADHSPFAYQCVTADKCTVTHLCFFSDDGRSMYISAWKYIGRFCNPYILAYFVILLRIEGCT